MPKHTFQPPTILPNKVKFDPNQARFTPENVLHVSRVEIFNFIDLIDFQVQNLLVFGQINFILRKNSGWLVSMKK